MCHVCFIGSEESTDVGWHFRLRDTTGNKQWNKDGGGDGGVLCAPELAHHLHLTRYK